MSESTSSQPAAKTSPHVEGLRTGEARTLGWIRDRCERRAARRFAPWAWAFIREDFAADVIAQLTVTVQKSEFELRGSFGAYVDRSIDNLCKRYFLTLARIRRAEPLDRHPNLTPAADRLERVAMAVDLKVTLNRLDPACRSLVLRKYVEGCSLQDLAQTLGISSQTVRSRLHTCRQRLRSFWFQLTGDRPPEGHQHSRARRL